MDARKNDRSDAKMKQQWSSVAEKRGRISSEEWNKSYANQFEDREKEPHSTGLKFVQMPKPFAL